MTSSIAGVLDNILATLLVSIYNFLYKPDGMIDIFSQYNDIINNILEKKNFISNVFDVLKLVGIALLVTSFLVSLMDKTSAGDFSINNFFRHLLKYFILYILLINANTILTDLLDITTGTFDALKTSTDEITANSAAVEFNHVFLANSVHKYMGFGARLGMFIMLIVPYAISVLFTIILNFFAVSRMIEMTVRVSVAPVVAGLSFFGNGADMDFVRFVKRTLGLFFQIIVILIICASITFVHNALVVTDENAHKSVNTVVDPAVKLKGSYTADYPEIEIRNMQTTKKQSVAEDKKIEYTSVETSREWKKAEKRTVKKEVTDNDHEDDDENGGTSEAYAKDDFKYFVNHIVDPSTFFISTGIMLSALFLIFRSREISTKLFA